MSHGFNPYESVVTESLQQPIGMQYLRSFHYIFENPNWLMNVLYVSLSFLSTAVIPVIGQLIVFGYQFEIIEALHLRPGTQYPDFDLNRLLDYLVRGFWVFLITLVVSVAFLPVILGVIVLVALMVGGAAAAGGEESAGVAMLVVVPLAFLLIVGVGVLMNLVMMPFMLRAGLTQDFGQAFDLAFARQFVNLMWREMILAGLFFFAAFVLLELVGLALFCVGIFVTIPVGMLLQAHLILQLYQLHLARERCIRGVLCLVVV